MRTMPLCLSMVNKLDCGFCNRQRDTFRARADTAIPFISPVPAPTTDTRNKEALMKTCSKAELRHIFFWSLSQCPSGSKEPICSTIEQVGESCCVQMCPTPPLYHSRPADPVSRTNTLVHGTPVPEGSRWLNRLILCPCPLPALCRCCFHSQLSEVGRNKKVSVRWQHTFLTYYI